MYTIFNNGKFATRDGTVASGSAMNPDINGGAIKTNSTPGTDLGLRAINIAQGLNLNPKLIPNENIGPADVSSFRNINSVTSGANGFTKIYHSGHGLVRDTIIVVTDTSGYIDGPTRIISVDANISGFTIPKNYSANIGTVTYATLTGTFGTNEIGNYTMKKVAGNLHNIPNTKLSSGAADYGRDSIHKMNAARVEKVATAIRSGYWNPFTGRFTTAPSTANDYAAMGVDNETINIVSGYTLGGEFAYNEGTRTVTSGNYERKTT